MSKFGSGAPNKEIHQSLEKVKYTERSKVFVFCYVLTKVENSRKLNAHLIFHFKMKELAPFNSHICTFSRVLMLVLTSLSHSMDGAYKDSIARQVKVLPH